MQLTLFTIAFALFLGASSFSLEARLNLSLPEFLKPTVRESADSAEKYYHKYFYEYFNWNLKSKGSISDILAEILLTPKTVFRSELPNVQMPTLSKSLINLVSLNKDYIDVNVTYLKQGLSDILKQFLIRGLLIEENESIVFPDYLIRYALKQVLAKPEPEVPDDLQSLEESRSSVIKLHELGNMLINYKNSELQLLLIDFKALIELRQGGVTAIVDLLTQLRQKLHAGWTLFDSEDYPEIAERINQLLLAIIKASPNKQIQAYNHVANYAKFWLSLTMSYKSVSGHLFGMILRKIFRIFAQANDLEVIRIGKALIIETFVPKDFGMPTDEYKRFIMRKYFEEGLRLPLVDGKFQYPVMQKLWAIDVIYTSFFMETELLTNAEIDFIFKNILEFFADHEEHVYIFFSQARKMVAEAGPDLQTFEPLFSQLYNTLLFAASYFQSTTKSMTQNFPKPALFIDTVVDELYKHSTSLKRFVNAWQPDPSVFNLKIKTNYVFYKLANLLTNAGELSEQPLKFLAFENPNDFLIRQYAMSEEAQLLYELLRQEVETSGSFNPHFYSNKVVSKEILRRMQKVLQLRV